MKKIITASLVAMMAVTAANAEIASTNFVTDRTGDVANSNYVKTLDDKTLTGAVDDLDNRISNMSEVTGETLSDLGTQIGKAQGDATSALNQIAALDNTYVTDTAFNADKEAQDNKISALETSLSANGTTGKAIAAAQGDATSALNQIAALDNTYVTDTAFNADKTAQDNKISALETSLSATGTTGKAIAAAQAQADKGVQDAAAAQGDATSALNQIAALDNTYVTDTAFNADKTAQDNKISALETSLSATGTTGKAIAAAQAQADKGVQDAAAAQAQADKGVQDAAAAQSDVDTVETNLGPLNGVKIANACTTGRCALVWENGQAKWETINY